MKHDTKRNLAFSIVFLAVTFFIVPFSARANNTTNSQNNTPSQLSGTVWKGAKAEVVTEKSKPLVFIPQVIWPGVLERFIFNENSTAPIAKLMAAIFRYGIQAITVITLIVIIFGGFMWSIAGGNGNKVSEAKQWIFSGLGGLALLMFSYLILKTINVNLVNLRTSAIDAITKLNLKVPEKSNQDQAVGDQGFLDKTYGEVFCDSGNPTTESCCVFYNENFSKVDGMSAFSFAWCADSEQKAINYCINYGRKMAANDPGGNGKLYRDGMKPIDTGKSQFYIFNDPKATTKKNPKKSVSDWGQKEYEKQQSDLGLYIIPGACWNLGSYVSKNTIGLDNPKYCREVANNNNGWACIVTNGSRKSWGYCDDEKCIPCSSFGKHCDHDYQCPNRKERIGNSTVVKEWQCGNGGLSGLANNKATCDGHFCECANTECFNECSKNLTDAGQQDRMKDVCGGK